jgi:FdhD protein
VAKIGCELILSKSAPTELALELAEGLGITTVGFIRNDSLNIYTCPERIQLNDRA